jgi:hypothetical protein
MGYEATMYLLERGVRLTGIDGWSWDAPFVYTAKKYAETKDASLIWEGTRPAANRLLPSREAAQSRTAAVNRLQGVMLPREDRTSLGGLDASGRDFGELSFSRPALSGPFCFGDCTGAPLIVPSCSTKSAFSDVAATAIPSLSCFP